MNNSISASDKLNKLQPAFEKSLEDAFSTMVFTPVTCEKPESKGTAFPTGAISGTISLAGEQFNGRLSLIFVQPVAELVFRSMMMMGDDDPVDETELQDAIGELANITAGGAKSSLQEEGFNFMISLPAVVVGTDHHLESPKNCAIAIIAVSLGDQKKFYMELVVK